MFQSVYGTGKLFAIYFGVAALAIGAASVFNSSVVMRLGMRFMTWRALFAVTLVSALFLLVVWQFDGVPPLWSFMVWLLAAFFATGILFGNFNALAMEPLGHMAGLGAAFVGSVSTFISLPLGWAIGYRFDNTVVPLIAGFAILGAVSLIVMWWTERGADLQA